MTNAKTFMLSLLLTGIFNAHAKVDFFNHLEDLDLYFEALEQQSKFQGVVLVKKENHILFHRAYGYADVHQKIKNESKHSFLIGSVAKPFTAVLVGMEFEKGTLSPETTVSEFISDFPRGDEITVKHLMSHTSGIVNYFPLLKDNLYEAYQPIDLIRLAKDLPLLINPGEGWDYSNTNYAILGYMLEEINGKTYQELLSEKIFGPLYMKQSGIQLTDVPNPAKGHGISASGELDYLPNVHHTVSYAAGNIVSSSLDLLRFSNALKQGKLISPETLTMMTANIKNGFGMGFYTNVDYGNRYYGHNGGTFGYQANWKYYPDKDMTVIILCNNFAAPFGKILGDMSKILFGQPFEMPVMKVEVKLSTEEMQEFTGSYLINEQMTLNIFLNGDKLYFQATGQAAFPALANDRTSFFMKNTDLSFTFVTDESGQVQGIEWRQGGRKDFFRKITVN